jgi:hypothetical protein
LDILDRSTRRVARGSPEVAEGSWGRRPPDNGAGEVLHPGWGARPIAVELARDWRYPRELSWHLSARGSTYLQSEGGKAYIAAQEEHHRQRTFEQELRELLEKHGVQYNPK